MVRSLGGTERTVDSLAGSGGTVEASVPKRPVRPSLGPDGTDGSTSKGARDGRVSWRPSRRQPGTDWRGLQVAQVAQFPGRPHDAPIRIN